MTISRADAWHRLRPGETAFRNDEWIRIPPMHSGYGEIRERHLGRIASAAEPDMAVEVDVGALVRRLLLFEHCILESDRLKEIPTLIAVFGVQGLLDLLDDGALAIVCDASTIGEIGRTAGLEPTLSRGGPLLLGGYRLASVSAADRQAYLHGVLQEVHRARIHFREAKRLKKALAGRLLTYPREAASSAVALTEADLVERPTLVAEAIRLATQGETGLDPGSVVVHAEPLKLEGDFRVSASIGKHLGLEPELEDRLVRQGLLAAAGLNQRLVLMKEFGAVTGFQNAELPLFATKLKFLADRLDPETQERRFDRILSITGLPDLRRLAPGIDVEKLLELRSKQEWREFRVWLRNIDTESDQQIAARFTDVRAQAAEMLQSTPGRAVRFLVTATAGLGGFIPGAAVSAVDAFLMDRLLGRPGPAAFISRWYPSIFREAPISD